ncbi:TetR/AcrR family transcriptional regulator [Streptomyces meridianus]|uniref:TetR/AcrR family transcriptional regulator n=1 Tax=Streptomyces meridianus TaxID=2938945 RepID=A0ABT0X089_9ACTN|nr:TetR/AcrR family transcriptional regulator [Streptomyces meridianus]MCM2575982.1 TetR/AcrR family transcriptional regulator [Streptomyces meridianus]
MTEGERIEKILNAAYTCFTRHGVRRTTMDDIARAAGMSRPAVYQYVRNKQDAFRRLAQHLLDRALAEARTAAGDDGPLDDRLAAVLESKIALARDLWRDSPAHAAELLGEDARLSEDLIGDYNDAMRALLVEVMDGTVPRPDASEFAEVLLALARGIEADLSDPEAPLRRLRQGVALLVAGLAHQQDPRRRQGPGPRTTSKTPSQEQT